jgi:hypothetical protein
LELVLQQILDIPYYEMGTIPPCTVLLLVELICIAAGDITSAAGGAPALIGLTGELEDCTRSGAAYHKKEQ